jgi:putative long chain acyl-CoA synthase
VAAYGVEAPGGTEVLVAAVELRAGRELPADALTAAMAHLPEAGRPAVVRIVPAIPRTTWWRPHRAALRGQGTDLSGGGWALGAEGTYLPTVAAARSRHSTAT